MASRRQPTSATKQRRERIIDVAVEMFSAMDYEDVSVDELCRRAEVAKGLVFYYFSDKRGLFAAAVEHVWDDLAVSQQVRPDEETVTEQMRGFLLRHFEYVNKHPKRFMILMSSGHAKAEVREIVQRARKQATSGITASLGCPVNPPPRLRQALETWAHFVDSVALDWIAHRDTTIDEMTDLCIQTLVAAVQSANGRPVDFEKELDALAQVVSVGTSSSPGAKPARKSSTRSPAKQPRATTAGSSKRASLAAGARR